MSITNYGELTNHVEDMLGRVDMTDMNSIWLQMVESKLYSGERSLDGAGWRRLPLRIPWMVTSNAEMTLTSGQGTFWSGFLEAITVRLDGKHRLQYLSPSDFHNRDGIDGSEEPIYYTTEGRRLYVGPRGAEAVTVSYYARFAEMSADSDTNTLLMNHPHIYINGMLHEAFVTEGADNLALQRKIAFDADVNGLVESERESETGGSPLQMQATWVV